MGEQELCRTDVIEQGPMPGKLVQHHAPVICVTNRRLRVRLRERKNNFPNSQPYFASIVLKNWRSPGLSSGAGCAASLRGPAMIDGNGKCGGRKVFVSLEAPTL